MKNSTVFDCSILELVVLTSFSLPSTPQNLFCARGEPLEIYSVRVFYTFVAGLVKASTDVTNHRSKKGVPNPQ